MKRWLWKRRKNIHVGIINYGRYAQDFQEMGRNGLDSRLIQLIVGFLNGLCAESHMTVSSKVLKANMFEVFFWISPGHMDRGTCPLGCYFEVQTI